jgi:acylphosphatase
MSSSSLARLRFEVFGKVQGVFFRKHTQQRAVELKLSGWVQNTDRKTVVGEALGGRPAVLLMQAWLSETGSPKSSILRCEAVMEDVDVEAVSLSSTFDIRRADGSIKTYPAKKKKGQ